MNFDIDGYRPTKYNDKFVTAAQQALSEFVDLIQPGTWIVDILPFRTSCTLLRETYKTMKLFSKACGRATPFLKLS